MITLIKTKKVLGWLSLFLFVSSKWYQIKDKKKKEKKKIKIVDFYVHSQIVYHDWIGLYDNKWDKEKSSNYYVYVK